MKTIAERWLQCVSAVDDSDLHFRRPFNQDVRFRIDDSFVDFNVLGEVGRGLDVVMSETPDNLVRDCNWEPSGYVVIDLPSIEARELKVGLTALLQRTVQSVVSSQDCRDFTPEKYHLFVQSDQLHAKVVDRLNGGIDIAELPLDKGALERHVSEACGKQVSVASTDLGETFSMRVVRPQSTDYNPPHRDASVPAVRNAINVYFPVAGSNEKSSLPLVPGSHRWKESEIERTASGALIDGHKYPLPVVIDTSFGRTMTRPPVGASQLLVFSPFLVHGGAVNFNRDMTRVSLEIRFWPVYG